MGDKVKYKPIGNNMDCYFTNRLLWRHFWLMFICICIIFQHENIVRGYVSFYYVLLVNLKIANILSLKDRF